MDCKLILCLMLLSYLVSAFPKSDEEINNNPDKDDDDTDFYPDEDDEDTDIYLDGNEQTNESTLADEEFKNDSITEKPRLQYEVTEIVIDIPDNRTKGPIVTNYTIYKPLNTVLTTDDKVTIENVTKNKCRKHHKKTTVTLNKSTEGKKSSITIFHVKAEYEDKTEKVTPQAVDFHIVPHLIGIKDYINGIKQGIVNGFNSIIHKNKLEDEGAMTPGPLGFLSKIHKKSTETAHKIHNVVFGHTIDDQ